ncbi:hypothetical protein [Mycolicibacterium sediminis]|uniref:hypothetical protein n=1 Tax=Mycolicibacterium sediminis TaxID=1286180 RepID=UPI0031F07691
MGVTSATVGTGAALVDEVVVDVPEARGSGAGRPHAIAVASMHRATPTARSRATRLRDVLTEPTVVG